MTAATVAHPTDLPDSKQGNVLTGTGALTRLMLRRDRLRLPIWILAITVFTLVSVAALPDLYPTAEDRQARAVLMENPGTRAISGPGYGLDDYTFGAMLSHEYLSWVAIFVALMSVFTVVRHTRTEEETGRAELVRSSSVGRHAPATAALTVAVGANLILGGLLWLGLVSLDLEGVGSTGSLLFGTAVASMGIVFAAVAAVTAQINQHGRGANGVAGAVFAIAFLLRAAGDMAEVGGSALSWLSPIGWAQQTRVYVDDRWWPLLLSLTLTAVLVAVAYLLSTRRDVGASLVEARPGRAHAPNSLSSTLGLAWRLHRSSIVWWSVAISMSAYGYGTLASEMETFVSGSSALEDAITEIGGTIVDAWIAVVILLFAVIAAVFTAITVLRARSEENGGRAEPVLATAVSKPRWLGSHLSIAFGGGAMLMLLTGLGFGLSVSRSLGDEDILGEILGAAIVHIPAVWLTAAIGVALYGFLPRATAVVWVVIAYAGLVDWLGALLRFPDWLMKLSPIGHMPLLPVESMSWTPLIVAAALAFVLVWVGFAGFRRRDLQTTA